MANRASSRRMSVTVALLHPFTPLFEVAGGGPRWGATWDELTKTDVFTFGEETVRDVLRRASVDLGVRITPEALELERRIAAEEGNPAPSADVADWLVWVGFRRADDDVVVETDSDFPVLRRDSRLRTSVVVVRDSAGRAIWRRPALEASIAELLDAQQAGLLDGDPLQQYLIPSIPQGDFGMAGEWVEFVQSLKVLWEVLEAAATVGGALGLFEIASRLRRRRTSGSVEVIDRYSKDWTARGAAPADLFQFLTSRERDSGEVAALLGCSSDEAQAILWSLGFAFDDERGVWRYRGDPEAILLADDVDFSFADVFEDEAGKKRLQEFASVRLEAFLRSGEAPTLAETQRLLEEMREAWLETPRDGDPS